MKKTIAGITALLTAVTLTACSNNEEPEATPANEVTDDAVADDTRQDSAENEATKKVGEEIQLAPEGAESDILLTVTDIKLGGECEYGTNDYGGEDDPDFGKVTEGKQLLQVWADVDAKNILTEVGNDWLMLQDPNIVDGDGYTQMPEMDVDCAQADDGHQMWSDTFDSGEKKKLYGSFIVPEDVKQVEIEGYRFDV